MFVGPYATAVPFRVRKGAPQARGRLRGSCFTTSQVMDQSEGQRLSQ